MRYSFLKLKAFFILQIEILDYAFKNNTLQSSCLLSACNAERRLHLCHKEKKKTLFWKKAYMVFTETSPKELHKVSLHNMPSQGNLTSVLQLHVDST